VEIMAASNFVEHTVETIATWQGVSPPNDVALRLVADLTKTISEFEALRGTLRFEDEPSSFEAALLEAASIGVVP
jgi:hypothetical protein